MTHETVRLAVDPNHEHVHCAPPRRFAVGADLRSKFATDAEIHIEVELTHPNGHPHHKTGDLMLFAAAELEHLD